MLEYDVEELETVGHNAEELKTHLNLRGQAGWELVSMVLMTRKDSGRFLLLTYRRR